jgi:tRNA_anti-like
MVISKKYIFILLAASIGIAVLAGYYFYNDEGINIEKADAVAADAPALYDAFIKDSTAAKNNYTGKILAVSGEVKQTSINQLKQTIILLKTNTGGASVNCTLEKNVNEIKPGSNITVKGICTGLGEGDADLGIPGDVYLVRGYLKIN